MSFQIDLDDIDVFAFNDIVVDKANKSSGLIAPDQALEKNKTDEGGEFVWIYGEKKPILEMRVDDGRYLYVKYSETPWKKIDRGVHDTIIFKFDSLDSMMEVITSEEKKKKVLEKFL
jgi:hypothetical protein